VFERNVPDVIFMRPPAGAGTAGSDAILESGICHRIRKRQGASANRCAANLCGFTLSNWPRASAYAIGEYLRPTFIDFRIAREAMATEERQNRPISNMIAAHVDGFLLDDTRRPFCAGQVYPFITQQFLRQVEWGELDYLVLILPPAW